MKFSQIVIKNLKNSLKNYFIYLLSLTISIIMFFSFDTLKYTNSSSGEATTKLITTAADIGEKFLFIIIIVFLLYANSLFLKRRMKSFGLFQLVGLTRKDLMKMLLIEQLCIFVSTLIVGSAIGVVVSRLLLLILRNVLHIMIDVSLTFQPGAFGMTVILLFISLLLIMLQSYIFMRKHSITQMMNIKEKSEVKHTKLTVFEVVLGIAGMIMIAAGYYLSFIMFRQQALLSLLMLIPFVILFLTVVGAYLFFRSTVSITFKTIKHFKKGHVSITDVVFTSPIMYRMKKNAFALTTIAIISAITVSILSFAVLTRAGVENNVKSISPYEFTYNNKEEAEQFEKRLQSEGILYDKYEQELLEVEDIKVNGVANEQTGINIASEKDFPNKQVEPSDAQIINPHMMAQQLNPLEKGDTIELMNQGHKVKVKVADISKEIEFGSSVAPLDQGVGIVDDSVYQQFKDTIAKDNHYTQIGFEIRSKEGLKEAESLNASINSVNTSSKSQLMSVQEESSGMFLFVTSFLGIVFLVAAGCIIYIKQMDEIEDEMDNYSILRKLGYTDQDMIKGLLLKTIFNFGVPLLIGLAHAFFAARAFNDLIGNPTLVPVYMAMGIYSFIYLIFAMITFSHTKRTIKFKS